MILSSSQNEFINTNKHIKLFCDNNNNWINPTNYEIEFLFNKIKYNSCFCNYYNKSRNHVMYNLVNYWMNFMKCKKKKREMRVAKFKFIWKNRTISIYYYFMSREFFFLSKNDDNFFLRWEIWFWIAIKFFMWNKFNRIT